MYSNQLNPWQLERIRNHVAPSLQYLDRLSGRMNQQRFPHDDELFASSEKVRQAVEELLRTIDRLKSSSNF